jgi:hypothetical protein
MTLAVVDVNHATVAIQVYRLLLLLLLGEQVYDPSLSRVG